MIMKLLRSFLNSVGGIIAVPWYLTQRTLPDGDVIILTSADEISPPEGISFAIYRGPWYNLKPVYGTGGVRYRQSGESVNNIADKLAKR